MNAIPRFAAIFGIAGLMLATTAWAEKADANKPVNIEADRVSASTVAGWTASGGSNASSAHTGRWSWQLGGSLEQKLTGLPNGTYALSVWAKSASGTLYAKGFGGTDQSTPLSAGASWTKVSLGDLAVSNGACTIGISSGSGNVDDFSLVKS